MSLDVRKIPVFTKYAERRLQQPQFLEYFNFEKGYLGLLSILTNFS